MSLTPEDLRQIAEIVRAEVRAALHPSVRLAPIASPDQPRTPSPVLTAAVAPSPVPGDGGQPSHDAVRR